MKMTNNIEDHPSNNLTKSGSICFSNFWEKDWTVKS